MMRTSVSQPQVARRSSSGRVRALRLGALACATLSVALVHVSSCAQRQILVPASLKGPRAMAIARGQVCMDAVEASEGIFEPLLRACDEPSGERGAIGLVVNDTLDRVAVVDMAQPEPRLMDLDLSTPGVNHIRVGQWPVDVAVNAQGTVAYTANQRSRSLSAINLWALRALPDELELPGVPAKVAVSAATGQVIAGLVEPSALWLSPGITCERVAMTQDRRVADPSQGCQPSSDEAASTLALPWGRLSDMKLSPDGRLLYVLYADSPALSVIGLTPDEACLVAGQQAPCEVARVSLTYECSDGLDNDGDGLIDQEDPQCFGPFHAESPGGVGVRAQGACADGLDNDGDGLIDRDDPDCASGGQDSEEKAPASLQVSACSDGVDNDGDGHTDYPADAQCYGAQGRAEQAPPKRGFSSLGIDELGAFLYVLDGPNQQVLVVDAARRALIDAPRTGQPTDPFATGLGVRLGRTPVPLAVTGRVSRAVFASPDADKASREGVIRYDYGAYVAADNGLLYYIDTARVYCEVAEPEALLTQAEFMDDPVKRAASREASCLKLPALALTPAPAQVESCQEVLSCQSCLEATPAATLSSCPPCARLAQDQERGQAFEPQLLSCQLQDQRSVQVDEVRLVVNPRLSLRDRLAERGGVVGRAVCQLSEEQIKRMETRAAELGVEVPLGCGSPLLPQPLSTSVLTTGPQRPADFLTAERLDFLEQRTLTLEYDQGGLVQPVVEVNRADERLLQEDLVVTYEGAIPSTRRSDGLIDQADSSRLLVGSLDVCRAGIDPGDLLILRTGPGTEGGGVPEACQAFVAPAGREADFLSYRITRALDGVLELAVIAPQPDGPAYVQELPTRACFPRGLSYEVRVPEQWLVSGSTTGVVTDRERVLGVCAPTQAALSGRASARARTGERYIGLYYSFWLYPGQVQPTRDLSFTMSVARSFTPASTESGLTIQPEAAAAAQVVFADRLPGGRFIFVLDASDDLIYARNLARGDEFAIR